MRNMPSQNAIKDSELKTTRASAIYVDLRNAILNGTLSPEAKLNVRSLSEQFQTGLSPIREALNRLATEGLAHHADNKGFVVSPISLDELDDLTQARCWMNDIGIRKSIELGGADWEERILIASHRLARCPRVSKEAGGSSAAQPDLAWDIAHKAFHQTLISACGSPWLIETCSQLFDSAERYRSLASLTGTSRSDPRDEHQDILNAALDRDADRAATLLTEHFQRTSDLVRRVIGHDPT